MTRSTINATAQANPPRFQSFANENENLSNVLQTVCLVEQKFSRPSNHAKLAVFGVLESIKHKFRVYQAYRFQNWYQSNTPTLLDYSRVLNKRGGVGIIGGGASLEMDRYSNNRGVGIIGLGELENCRFLR